MNLSLSQNSNSDSESVKSNSSDLSDLLQNCDVSNSQSLFDDDLMSSSSV
jgi:hypothetical protein